MKKFLGNLLQVLLLAAIVVLVNNEMNASTEVGNKNQKFSEENIQTVNFPVQLFFNKLQYKSANGNCKNKIPGPELETTFLHDCDSSSNNLYFQSIPPACQDLQYTIRIQLYPSHYFW